MQPEKPPALRAKRKRPDGTDSERYKDSHKWTCRRWAWEFLRRNPDYINACRSVRDGDNDDQQRIADEFGLKAFKDYREGYSGGCGQPRFALAVLTLKSNLEVGRNMKGAKLLRIGYGQVGVRFDMNHALEDSNALAKQLRIAGKVLRDRLKQFELEKNRKSKPAKFQPRQFKEYLRILDCKSSEGVRNFV